MPKIPRSSMQIAAVILFLSVCGVSQTFNDSVLKKVTEEDSAARAGASGTLPVLQPAEHLYRADVYQSNRLFANAREHWLTFLKAYPNDPGVPRAFLGIGRGYMWERDYERAIGWFARLEPDHAATKEGREGLAFRAASHVRIGKHAEAVRLYERYVSMYPTGERIDSAHLNIIDSNREAGRYREANDWVAKTRNRFPATPTETNALQAKLRMELFRGLWSDASATADTILALNKFTGSMATADEIRYLKGYALEKAGGRKEAVETYSLVTNAVTSYWGSLAGEGIRRLDPKLVRPTASVTPGLYDAYPVQFREIVLKNAKAKGLDPRFLLAIMKQESSFQTRAKSPAAARGLLQLVLDTAVRYSKEAGYPNLSGDDLYDPATNVAIGAAYIAALRQEFGGLYEGIAASYNGGEDNALRWLARTNPKDPGVFTAEIGFAETKNYVYKVMGNYRAYVTLYDENLSRR